VIFASEMSQDAFVGKATTWAYWAFEISQEHRFQTLVGRLYNAIPVECGNIAAV